MLAADQEGGLVQRLKGPGFTTNSIGKPPGQAIRCRAPPELPTTGAASSRQPVSTPIWRQLPTSCQATMMWMNQPIGQLRRGYGSSPKTVAAKVTAFTEGMNRAGVATAVKHFPGLGEVRGNTDYVTRVVDTDHDAAR